MTLYRNFITFLDNITCQTFPEFFLIYLFLDKFIKLDFVFH